jgi:hypothetical protein
LGGWDLKGEKQKGSSGNGLRSHTATGAVSSALTGLTTGFEKGPGVTPPLLSPKDPD